eukprot:3345120-Rhodomonas_salina.2
MGVCSSQSRPSASFRPCTGAGQGRRRSLRRARDCQQRRMQFRSSDTSRPAAFVLTMTRRSRIPC